MTDASPSPTLPIGLKRIAEVIGVQAAMLLADHFGGQERCPIARNPKPTHPWAQVIGIEALRELGAAFGGQELDIPRGVFSDMKKAHIARALDENPQASRREIAQAAGVTMRYVRRVASDLGLSIDPDQGDLF